jgi:hypothetical protein
MRRGIELDIHGANRKGDALLGQFAMVNARFAQPFGAAALEELEIGGMVDIAGKVGVFVVDPHRKAMLAHAPPPSSTTTISGGAPKRIGRPE